MKKFIVGMCFVIGSTVTCLADQPTCTGDRHYDTAGNCVAVDPPTTGKCSDGSTCDCGTKCPDQQDCRPCTGVTIPTTTTTTLPGLICPLVSCLCKGNQPTTVVVDPCPPVQFPNYIFCRVVKVSRRHPNGLKCRSTKRPFSLWVPSSVAGAF